MLQLHLSDQQFYCLLVFVLHWRSDSNFEWVFKVKAGCYLGEFLNISAKKHVFKQTTYNLVDEY